MDIVKKTILLTSMILTMVFLSCVNVAYAQTIISFISQKSVYSPGGTAIFNAKIHAENTITDHKTNFIIMKTSEWELIPISGDTTVYTTEMPLNMIPGEQKNSEYEWKIPNTAEPGIYRAMLLIESPSGLTKAFMPELFKVLDVDQQIKSIKLWNLIFEYKGEQGSDLEGFHVDPDSEFSMRFNIQNTGNIRLDLRVYVNFTQTFDPTKSAFLEQKSLTLDPGETKLVVFYLVSPSEPMSYTPIIDVFGDDVFGELVGRLVVEGVSGTILDAYTDKPLYLSGEYVNTSVTVIGSADYKSKTDNVELSYEISDSKGEVLTNKEMIDLTSNPVEFRFSDVSPRDFFDYRLNVYLKKDGNILSEFQSDYLDGTLPIETRDIKDIEDVIQIIQKNQWILILINFIIIGSVISLILFFRRRGARYEE